MKNARKLTVLLADDDRIILDDITQMLNWEELGFQIVGKARSGKQALTLYRDLKPNIVITDIIMPSMDGIELIREIQKIDHKHLTKFLILSSYGDFSYAKSAIQLGISDYLLKPELNAPALENVLRKLAAEILSGSMSKFNLTRLQLSSYFKHASIDPDGFDLESHFVTDSFFFFLCSVYKDERLLTDPDEISTLLKAHMSDIVDILELSTEDCFFSSEHELLFGISKKKTLFSPEILCHSIQSLFEYLGAACRILYTGDPVTLVSYKKNYLLHKNIFQYHLSMEQEPRFMKLQNISLPASGSARCIIPEYEDFLPLIKARDAGSQIQELFHMLHHQQDYDGLQKLLRNLCKYFSLSPAEELPRLTSADAIRAWFESNLEHADSTQEDSFENYSSHVRNAAAFMKGHYIDSTLSIDSIAEQAGISPGRLSVLFKKETGMTVNEYLTRIRIHAAIDLLKNSNYKIYEIAERVGYNSSQYFSRIFFSTTGHKPLDYRNHSFTKFTLGE